MGSPVVEHPLLKASPPYGAEHRALALGEGALGFVIEALVGPHRDDLDLRAVE
jgi:hypothetical protein